jgi:acetyl-CoA carboxylase biotin carboxylase subunit
MLKATAGGGKGMRAVWKMKIYWKHGMELVKNLLLLLGMMECILKTNRRASSYRNSGHWDSYGKACHLSERDCSVQRRHNWFWRNSFTIYDRRIASKMGEAAVKAAEYIKYEGAER